MSTFTFFLHRTQMQYRNNYYHSNLLYLLVITLLVTDR